MPYLVVAAVDPDAAVLRVLAPVRGGLRAVLESCTCTPAELHGRMQRLADLYGQPSPGQWSSPTAGDAARVRELVSAMARGDVLGEVGSLAALLRVLDAPGEAMDRLPAAERVGRAAAACGLRPRGRAQVETDKRR